MLKKFLTVLIVTSCILGGNLVNANASENATKISIHNIEKIMLENSIDLKMTQNTFDKFGDEYEDLNDDLRRNLPKNIKKLNDEIEELDTKINGEINEEEKKKLEEDKKDKIDLRDKKTKEKDELEEKRDSIKYDMKIKRINLDENIKASIFSAEQKYIDHVKKLSDQKVKKFELDIKQKKNDALKLKYELGFISKKEYDSNVMDITDSKKEYLKIENELKMQLKDLKFILGLPIDEEVEIDTNIETDLEEIEKIDLESDTEDMIKNSKLLQRNRIQIEQAEKVSSEDGYEMDNLELGLEKNDTSLKLNFERKYNDLVNSHDDVKSLYEKVKQKEDELSVLYVKHNYGFISKNELKYFESEIEKQNCLLNNSLKDLYTNYIQYLKMRDGYSNIM